MRSEFQHWSNNSSEEVTSLINSFQASSMSEMQQRAQVCHLEDRLSKLENEAYQVVGQNSALMDTTRAIRAAELYAANVGRHYETQAHREASAAVALADEVGSVKAATATLRDQLRDAESNAAVSAEEKRQLVAQRQRLDSETELMVNQLLNEKERLRLVGDDVARGQAANAAESKRLNDLHEQCVALQTQALSAPPPLPPPSGAPRDNSIPLWQHQEILDQAFVMQVAPPLQQALAGRDQMINDLRVKLMETNTEMTRISALCNSLQDESRNVVPPLAGPTNPAPLDYDRLCETMLHRFVSLGVIKQPSQESSERGVISEDGEGSTSHGAGGSEVAEAPAKTSRLMSSKTPKQVRVPKFPSVTQLQDWGHAIARELVASSVYDDKDEVRWFQRASAKRAKYEELADVGEPRFAPLDSLLCSALIKTLPSDLRQKVRRK